MTKKHQCRICNSVNTENLGILPKQTHFANKKLDQNLPESSLYRCKSCLTLMRHPILSIAEYNLLYKQADSTIWSNKTPILRPDQEIVKNIIINDKKAGKILDIGCYTGDFLSSFSDDYVKFGIEMSIQASEIAASRNIKIIGNDLYKINTIEKFDFIVAMDVLEHTENPIAFIKIISSMLTINGKIII
jgi:SAM-dependent methyltransferase